MSSFAKASSENAKYFALGKTGKTGDLEKLFKEWVKNENSLAFYSNKSKREVGIAQVVESINGALTAADEGRAENLAIISRILGEEIGQKTLLITELTKILLDGGKSPADVKKVFYKCDPREFSRALSAYLSDRFTPEYEINFLKGSAEIQQKAKDLFDAGAMIIGPRTLILAAQLFEAEAFNRMLRDKENRYIQGNKEIFSNSLDTLLRMNKTDPESTAAIAEKILLAMDRMQARDLALGLSLLPVEKVTAVFAGTLTPLAPEKKEAHLQEVARVATLSTNPRNKFADVMGILTGQGLDLKKEGAALIYTLLTHHQPDGEPLSRLEFLAKAGADIEKVQLMLDEAALTRYSNPYNSGEYRAAVNILNRLSAKNNKGQDPSREEELTRQVLELREEVKVLTEKVEKLSGEKPATPAAVEQQKKPTASAVSSKVLYRDI